MRIIGGKYKGRRIVPFTGLKVRPTTDYAREGLFNILNNRIDLDSASVLDLFAGTGSISFEFASRGAPVVHSVEKELKQILSIRRIINDMGFTNIRAVHIDVMAYLRICRSRYDIVFADPPYDLMWLSDLPELVCDAGIMNDNGIFILEHSKSIKFHYHSLFFEHRNYGAVNFSFFRPINI